jgi:hypothetical protein
MFMLFTRGLFTDIVNSWVYTQSNDVITEWWIGNDLEVSDCGLI